MQLKKLASQTAIYGISSIVARLINYLLTPYLTRILTPESYGVIGDMYALIPFCLVLLTMGMETGYFRYAGKSSTRQEQDSIFTTSMAAVSSAALLFLAVIFIFKTPIDIALKYEDQSSITTLVALIVALDVITAIPFTRLRQQQRANRYVVVRVVSILVNVIFCLFFFSALPTLAESYGWAKAIYSPTFGVGYVFVANLLSSLTSALMLSPQLFKVKFSINLPLLRSLALYSLPLLLSGIVGTANEFIDRQLIKYLTPESMAMSQLGIYAAVVRISVVMVLFTQMYRFAAEPFFLSGFKKEEFKESSAAALKYYVIASLVIALVVTLNLDLFALLVGESFREAIYIVPILIVSNLLAGVLFNLSFWYKYTEQTKYALYITLAGLFFTVTLNIILIPKWGYYGAAMARLACEAVMVIISYVLNQRHFPIKYDIKAIFSYTLLAITIYLISSLVNCENKIAYYALNSILILIFVLVAYKREIKLIK